jgi:short-subunit dehydrogenase
MAYAAAGKRVLITGASSGLGAALARQLAARGAVVGLIARRRDRLAEVLADCRHTSPSSAVFVADLVDTSALGDLALRAWDALGGIDVIEPGPVDTEIWDHPGGEEPLYQGPKVAADVVADGIIAALGSERFEHYLPGQMALEKIVDAKNADLDAYIAGAAGMASR